MNSIIIKRFLFLILAGLLFLSMECGIFGKKKASEAENIILKNTGERSNIDFKGLYEKVKKADKIDMEIFLSIGVLQKKYVSEFIPETEKMADEQKRAFFQEKNKEFFNTIKFKENEYNTFLEKNVDKLNDYQNLYPELRDYLTSQN
jgi:hypothetical protein